MTSAHHPALPRRRLRTGRDAPAFTAIVDRVQELQLGALGDYLVAR